MRLNGLYIRPEKASDHRGVMAVIQDAFLGHPHSNNREAAIVSALRESGSLPVSLVAELNDKVVGQIAFSPVVISDNSKGWYGLGPLAVAKDWQRKGIGPQLVKEGLAALRELDAKGCVVFGDPGFYQRFGFINIEKLLLSGYPSEYFRALSFGSTFPSGEVAYHPAFDVCL